MKRVPIVKRGGVIIHLDNEALESEEIRDAAVALIRLLAARAVTTAKR